MAFGTGSHETTQLCASRLLDYYQALPSDPSNLKIVDAGCGSGILALSAKILGFKNVHGFDNDPDALAVCVENQALNPHIESIHFSVDDKHRLSRRRNRSTHSQHSNRYLNAFFYPNY